MVLEKQQGSQQSYNGIGQGTVVRVEVRQLAGGKELDDGADHV